jgi:tellurite resistance protein TerC
MGLRQLYFLLEGLLSRLIFLSKGLSFSLGVIVATLIITTVGSLTATRKDGTAIL